MRNLTRNEAANINGGCWGLLIGLLIATLNDISNNPEQFQDAATNGWGGTTL